ncbi:hypothetical protein D3C75_632180 [compost metagenome]
MVTVSFLGKWPGMDMFTANDTSRTNLLSPWYNPRLPGAMEDERHMMEDVWITCYEQRRKKRAFNRRPEWNKLWNKSGDSFLQHSAGGYIMGIPVPGGDGGYADSVHGRCIMYDFSVSYVDAHMIDDSGGACPEKDQIASLQIASGNRCTGALLVSGAPFEAYAFHAEYIFGEG